MQTDYNVKSFILVTCTFICMIFAISTFAIYIDAKDAADKKDRLAQESQIGQTEASTDGINDAETTDTVVDATQVFYGEADQDSEEKVHQYLSEHQDLLNQNNISLDDALKGTIQIVGDNSYIVEVGEYDIFVNLRDDIISVDLRSNIRGQSEDNDPVSAICTAITASSDTLDEAGISADDLIIAISDGTVSCERKSSYLYEVDYDSHHISINTLQDKVSAD